MLCLNLFQTHAFNERNWMSTLVFKNYFSTTALTIVTIYKTCFCYVVLIFHWQWRHTLPHMKVCVQRRSGASARAPWVCRRGDTMTPNTAAAPQKRSPPSPYRCSITPPVTHRSRVSGSCPAHASLSGPDEFSPVIAASGRCVMRYTKLCSGNVQTTAVTTFSVILIL